MDQQRPQPISLHKTQMITNKQYVKLLLHMALMIRSHKGFFPIIFAHWSTKISFWLQADNIAMMFLKAFDKKYGALC